MFDIRTLTRKNIQTLQPYASARDEFSGSASVFLDANENSLGSPLGNEYNRYPDPHQRSLKQAISTQWNIPGDRIFLGNGSDECIDLLYRCFCEPGIDNVIICPPTYGMYAVSAQINDVQVKEVPLLDNFQLDGEGIWRAMDSHTKIIWICSPNNPTGNRMAEEVISNLCEHAPVLVVIDEAYIDFSDSPSHTHKLDRYPNLVVLQTFSKAWGLAALRLGIAFANKEIITVLDHVKPPYNISGPTQKMALEALQETRKKERTVQELLRLRDQLRQELEKTGCVEWVYQSDANFILARMSNAMAIYDWLLNKAVVVRNRSNIVHCAGCLRITVGTKSENEQLMNALSQYSNGLL